MAPPDARRNFVQTLRQVAEKHSLQFTSLSHDWILQFRDQVGLYFISEEEVNKAIRVVWAVEAP